MFHRAPSESQDDHSHSRCAGVHPRLHGGSPSALPRGRPATLKTSGFSGTQLGSVMFREYFADRSGTLHDVRFHELRGS